MSIGQSIGQAGSTVGGVGGSINDNRVDETKKHQADQAHLDAVMDAENQVAANYYNTILSAMQSSALVEYDRDSNSFTWTNSDGTKVPGLGKSEIAAHVNEEVQAALRFNFEQTQYRSAEKPKGTAVPDAHIAQKGEGGSSSSAQDRADEVNTRRDGRVKPNIIRSAIDWFKA